MLWAMTGEGKRMPIDPWHDPEGNCATRLVAGVLVVRVFKGGRTDVYPGETRRATHFATCKKYRRPAKPKPSKRIPEPSLFDGAP